MIFVPDHPPWVKKVDPVHVERSKDSFHLKVIPIKKDEETQYLKKAYKSGFFFIQGSFYNMRHESYKSVHFNLALNFSSTSQTPVNQSYNILLGAMVNFRSCFILGQTWVTIGSVVIPRSWLDGRTLEIPEKCQKVLLYDNLMSLTPLNFTMAKFQGKILLQSCLIAC